MWGLNTSGGCFWKTKIRSSRPEAFCKKGVFENVANQRCFPKNAFYNRTHVVAASEKLKAEAVIRRCFLKKVFLEILLNLQENTCARVSFLQPYNASLLK